VSPPIDIPIHRFSLAGFEVSIAEPWLPSDPAAAVQLLVDPERSEETIHWGRNYLYRSLLPMGSHEQAVVVKQFTNHGLVAQTRRRSSGSKATKSWNIARELQRHGLPTPEPIMVIESTEDDGPSYFVSAALEGFFEMRYYFRALLANRELTEFPDVDSIQLFEALGRAIGRMHEAGIWHRDMTIGNLLVRYERGPAAFPTIYVVDLNRARSVGELSPIQRVRDLCRLPIERPALVEAFLRAYWRHPDGPLGWRLGLYRAARASFDGKNRTKAMLRKPGTLIKRRFGPRTAHEHIPDADEGSELRNRAVWDELSDQPHQHAGRAERAAIRLADVRAHLGDIGRALGSIPKVWARYRTLRRSTKTALPRPWGEPGIAIDGETDDPGATLDLLQELGIRRVLVRLQPWAESFDRSESLCSALHARGYELAFALPQNRELVLDLDRWREAIEEIATRFTHYGRTFQIGQAVNRSKWGIWRYDEFEELATIAMEILRDRGDVEIIGPGVIDFELHATMALVNRTREGYHFDALSSLLYVDRRGAPENPQLGFDTVAKVTLAKAIADTGHSVDSRSWVTEVNWPLFEGPHAPAGSEVAVHEPEQADYLARYYLLTLASGTVERVYWWQLIARGYGLVDRRDDGTLRRRAAFDALRTLHQILDGSVFLGALDAPSDAFLYHFRLPDGDEVVVCWSNNRRLEARLPRRATDAVDRDGKGIQRPEGLEVELNGSPRYFRLERV